MRIIGIDPGSRKTGFGIIEKQGGRLAYISSGTINASNEGNLETRLKKIFQELSLVAQEYQPAYASIEKIFHSTNARSSLILGHARGIALLSVTLQEIEIKEYSPTEVKSAVVGVGRATKEQIGKMVNVLLNQRRKMGHDESDALAVAICHASFHSTALHRKS